MSVFISVDMEGVTGVVYGNQVNDDTDEYQLFQELMIGDTNAAIEGCLEAGAKEVIVNDSHGGMTNLLLKKLNPEARLISGSDKPLSMMQGVEGSEGALFIGYHGKIGTKKGVLAHTYFASNIYQVLLNDMPVGEPEINAALAGHFGVPVLFLSGGETVCEQIQDSIGPWVDTVAVKRDIGRGAAECLHPEKTHRLIKEGVKKALEDKAKAELVSPELPVTFEVQFFTSQMADKAEIYPYSYRVDGRTIRVEGEDMLEAFRAFYTVAKLGTAPIF
ncbi:M55 family metallopeptidase [Candidatus Bipolaricaulota bacterium]|nr:M55 family metallopeptidase [Candidatus Bipolaricaulota bacterium]